MEAGGCKGGEINHLQGGKLAGSNIKDNQKLKYYWSSSENLPDQISRTIKSSNLWSSSESG